MSPSDPSCARALALLRRHGDDPTSFQILEPGLQYWFDDDEAVVAYTDTGAAWVTVGEPVCDQARRADVVTRFAEAARAVGRRVRFFHVSAAFTGLAALTHTHVGELPVWDPGDWEANVKRTRSLREQLRRARAKGVRTRLVDGEEFDDPAAPLRIACDRLIARWLGGRGMSELKFMVRLAPYGYANERRYAIAEQGDQLRGVAVAIPIYKRGGWFIEDLLRDPDAPNGTAELLVDTLMRHFAESGSRYATLGLAPLAGEVRPLLAATRHYTARLYNFPGVRSFKDKLRPGHWEPVHLAYPRGELGFLAMRDVLAAFAPAGLLRFGLQTLVHQRTLATGLLATLLVPWTMGLMLIDTATWFPSAGIQRAWVAFDVLLIGLMFALVRRWRAPLAVLVVALTSADALLTTLQVLLWNVWTTRTAAAWLLVALGCTGPLLAATFFWSVRRVAMRGRHTLA